MEAQLGHRADSPTSTSLFRSDLPGENRLHYLQVSMPVSSGDNLTDTPEALFHQPSVSLIPANSHIQLTSQEGYLLPQQFHPQVHSLDKKRSYGYLGEKISQQHCDCYKSHRQETTQYPHR